MPSRDLPRPVRFKGKLSEKLRKILRAGMRANIIAMGGIIAFGIISLTGAPFGLAVPVQALFAGSVVYLSGVSYGIINDILGCRRCLPYFLVGHQPDQASVVRSNDPNVNGIAWGILATFPLASLAGVLFMLTTLVTGFCGLPFAGFVFPLFGLVVPAILWKGERAARQLEASDSSPYQLWDIKFAILVSDGLNDYQKNTLNAWIEEPKDFRAWEANSARNRVGYRYLPLAGLVLLIAVILMSAMHHLLPEILFDSGFSVIAPLSLGLLMTAGVASACAAFYRGQDRQVDNRYLLDFSEEGPDNAAARLGEEKASTYRVIHERSGIVPAPVVHEEKSPLLQEIPVVYTDIERAIPGPQPSNDNENRKQCNIS